MNILIPVVTLIFLMALGLPIGFSLGAAGLLGLYLIGGLDVVTGLLAIVPFRTSASFILTTIPMFVLMAEFVKQGGLAKDLCDSAQKWLGHLPGGLAIAAIAACAGMGALTGASTAAAAAIGGTMMPQMKKYGYNRSFASGTLSMGGTLAIMIPPSIPMIIYGTQTETSIGELFIAGIIPGIISAIFYSILIIAWCKIRPEIAPQIEGSSWRAKIESLKDIWPVSVLVVAVIGGMYSGLVTPTEAGAVGAAGAFTIMLILRRLTSKDLVISLYNTALTTTMIMTIVFGAHFFSYFITISGASDAVAKMLESLQLSPVLVIILVIVPIWVLLGMFMDNLPILLLTLPVMFPPVVKMGFDPVWFGVLCVALGEVGLITPPVGLVVFVVSSITEVPLHEVFRGAIPYIIAEAVVLALLIAFPQLATFLPALMR